MRSDLIKKGPTRAPHRSLLKAMGITESEMKKPFVAVVSAKSDYIPGHKHLDDIAEEVKAGIRNAGGVPFEFNTIGVCDGIAMNHKGMKYSLCSREIIADSIEIMLTAHPLDAVVFIPNCDKIVPGMLIAACRMNLPSVFVSGGPMLPVKKTVLDMVYPKCSSMLVLVLVVRLQKKNLLNTKTVVVQLVVLVQVCTQPTQ